MPSKEFIHWWKYGSLEVWGTPKSLKQTCDSNWSNIAQFIEKLEQEYFVERIFINGLLWNGLQNSANTLDVGCHWE